MEILTSTGFLTRESSLGTQTAGFKKRMKIFHTLLHETPTYAYIASKGNTAKDQIAVGWQWARLNLKATQVGLSLHPVSQALQEYPRGGTAISQNPRFTCKTQGNSSNSGAVRLWPDCNAIATLAVGSKDKEWIRSGTILCSVLH